MNQKNLVNSCCKTRFKEPFISQTKDWVKTGIIISGVYERRYIRMIRINSTILKQIFNTNGLFLSKLSFNLMMITNDHKVLLLQRSESFHFSKILNDLKFNRINFNLLGSLYTSEVEKLRRLFFDFMPPFNGQEKVSERLIHIFPGGQSNYNETIILTLLREFKEETSITIDPKNLSFNQSCIFKVSILDLLVERTFNNFIFPVKVNMSSQDIYNNFKETKHTRNPTFIDIDKCNSLFDAFVRVQNFMLL